MNVKNYLRPSGVKTVWLENNLATIEGGDVFMRFGVCIHCSNSLSQLDKEMTTVLNADTSS